MSRYNKSEYRLSRRFWTRFRKEYWEKQPLVLKSPFAAPVATPAEVFAAIIAVREKLARNEKRRLRCFVGKEVRRSGLRGILPRSSDGDFVRYRQRIRHSLGNKRFGLVIVDYSEFHAEIRRRIKQFLGPLKTALGPGIKSKVLLFAGDYQRTPVGIHKDPHGTFVFIIEGRKRFRAWPSDFFPDEISGTGRLRYREFLPDAITLEGTAGDLIYWPSSYWHIGEPVGGFSISLNVGIFGLQAGRLSVHPDQDRQTNQEHDN